MGTKSRGPYLPNIEPIMAAGIDPKTGLPYKMGGTPCTLKEDIRKILRVNDEQDAVNRYKWYNLPDGITSQMIERMLYYRGQLCFFYDPILEQFFIMPYALDGGIDYYGRFKRVHPVPWSNGSTDEEKAELTAQREYLSTLKLKPLYEVLTTEELLELGEKALTEHCVLLKDYTEQVSQTIISRQVLNDPLLDLESELIPYMRTALLRASGVKGVRVGNQDEADSVKDANEAMKDAALEGEVNIPIIGNIEFQELNDGTVGKAEEFMQAYASLENFRLGSYGIENGGVYQKQAHMLQSEQNLNAAGGGAISLRMQDGLSNRQYFCDIVNSQTGLNIWCDVSETISGTDKNLDGELSDQQDQSGSMPGSQPAGGIV